MILGGGGVFANHLARHLLYLDQQVVSIGRSNRQEHFSLNVGKNDDNYSYKKIHIFRQWAELQRHIDQEEPDYIVNFAALAYATSWDNPEPFYNTNLIAPVRILEYIKGYPIKFIQIGSSEVYGSTESPATEDTRTNPTSPYAVSKLATDLHLMTLPQSFNIIRPSNCYGEGQYTYRIIPKLILSILKGEKFPLQGGGVVEKSFMHAEDLAVAIDMVCFHGSGGEIYNVGPDKPVSMRTLSEKICELMGVSFDVLEIAPARENEDFRYWVNSDKIRRLGWEQKISLEEGLTRMIDWCKKYQEELEREPGYYELRP